MEKIMNKWIYLSYSLNPETPSYGGGDSIEIYHSKSIEKGDSCNTSYWSLTNHLGTHIDLPRHFVANGKTLNDYNPGFFIFYTPFILDISPVEPGTVIEPDYLNLDDVPADIDMFIIKTGFCLQREKEIYWKENPGFASSLAAILRERFPYLRILGFDSISLSSFAHRKKGHEAHKAFLDYPSPILLLEDMDLTIADNNMRLKQVVVSPLRVEGADGAPCTVFANVFEQGDTL